MAKISPETLPKTLIGLNVLVLHVWRLEQSSQSSTQKHCEFLEPSALETLARVCQSLPESERPRIESSNGP